MTPDELLRQMKNGAEEEKVTISTSYNKCLRNTIAMFRTLREKMKKEGDNPCMIAAVINNALPTEETLKEYEK